MLDLYETVDRIRLENFSPNGEWEVKETRAQWLEYWLKNAPGPFSMIRFSITLKRKVIYIYNLHLLDILMCYID